MGLMLPPIEAYQVQHLPIVKAYADKIGLVEAINAVVPTEMGVDPGTIVLGMILWIGNSNGIFTRCLWERTPGSPPTWTPHHILVPLFSSSSLLEYFACILLMCSV